jgi:hypothetical protein
MLNLAGPSWAGFHLGRIERQVLKHLPKESFCGLEVSRGCA